MAAVGDLVAPAIPPEDLKMTTSTGWYGGYRTIISQEMFSTWVSYRGIWRAYLRLRSDHPLHKKELTVEGDEWPISIAGPLPDHVGKAHHGRQWVRNSALATYWYWGVDSPIPAAEEWKPAVFENVSYQDLMNKILKAAAFLAAAQTYRVHRARLVAG